MTSARGHMVLVAGLSGAGKDNRLIAFHALDGKARSLLGKRLPLAASPPSTTSIVEEPPVLAKLARAPEAKLSCIARLLARRRA
ncbi:hypothetical protein ABIB68_008049 [Bradyrhizobium sp. F1.2.2]